MIIKEPVQRLPHGGEIRSTDQHVDFGLAQFNRDAFTSRPVAADRDLGQDGLARSITGLGTLARSRPTRAHSGQATADRMCLAG
jgi:hypothetical protein